MRLNGGIRPGWDQFGSMHAIKKNYGAMYLGCTRERERERTVEMGKNKREEMREI